MGPLRSAARSAHRPGRAGTVSDAALAEFMELFPHAVSRFSTGDTTNPIPRQITATAGKVSNWGLLRDPPLPEILENVLVGIVSGWLPGISVAECFADWRDAGDVRRVKK